VVHPCRQPEAEGRLPVGKETEGHPRRDQQLPVEIPVVAPDSRREIQIPRQKGKLPGILKVTRHPVGGKVCLAVQGVIEKDFLVGIGQGIARRIAVDPLVDGMVDGFVPELQPPVEKVAVGIPGSPVG